MNTNYSGIFSKSLNALDSVSKFSGQVVANPLEKFPTKGDVIRGTFVTKKLKPLSKSQADLNTSSQDQEQWLYPDKIPDATVSFVLILALTPNFVLSLESIPRHQQVK